MAHSVPEVAARRGIEIDEIAFDLVRVFQPNAVMMVTKFDVERFFELKLKEQTGVEPVYRSLGGGLEGYLNVEGMQCVICSAAAEYGEDDTKRRRLRATQAHEIGHCHLHLQELRQTRAVRELLHDRGHADLGLHKQEEVRVCRNPEWQAWRFAGALLMPEVCVRRAVDCGGTLQTMSRAFDVNPSFVGVRLHDLKIVKHVRAR